MYLPFERELYLSNKKQEQKRKLIVNAGRRSGKSIWSLLSIAKEYLPKEDYEKLVTNIKAQFEPLGKRYGLEVCEVDDIDNWESADEIFRGN